MNYIKDRKNEASTIAGIGMILSAISSILGLQLGHEIIASIATGIGGIIGAFEVVRREKK